MKPTVAWVAASIIAIGALVLLLGCASTPTTAAALKASYDTLDAVEKLTLTLVQTRQINKTQAEHVAALAHEAKSILDEATVILTATAAGGAAARSAAPPGAIAADLALAQNVLTELQVYLQGIQGAKP